MDSKTYSINKSLTHRHFDSLGVLSDVVEDFDFRIFKKNLDWNEPEHENMYWYHKDHLGSSTQISDYRERVIHHIEYMPSGEQFSEQRDNWATPYKFNGKELDAETGLYYYGARYYTPEIGIWLSVDPLSDKYPHQSNYMFCSGRLVNVIDPDGRDEWDVCTQTGKMTWIRDSDKDVMFLTLNDKRTGGKSKEFDKKVISMGSKKDKDGKPIYTDLSFKDGATSSANQNATDVFNFLADNTEVEWGKLSITEKSTESTNITVHSSHGKTSENRSTTIAISTNTEYFTVLDHTHSHPNKIYSHDQPHCPQCSSDADRAFRDKLLIKFPNATTNIRHSKGYERSYKNDTNVNYGK